jgi:hypothetical protein
MTRKHFDELAIQLGLRLAQVADENTGAARQDAITGFWHGVAAVRAAGRFFNSGFDSTRFDNKVIDVALHQLNIEHRFNPAMPEWTRANVIAH